MEQSLNKTLIEGTQLSAFPIALGTDVYGLTLSEEESRKMLDYYISRGGNLIDTALVYSDWVPGERSRSEKLLGRYLKKSGKRNELIISTKGAHPEIGHMDEMRLSENEIRGDMEKSLMNLGVEHVDIYWLHRDHKNADIAEICHTLNSLVKEGKTRYFGLSNWTAQRMEEFNRYAEEHGMKKAVSSQLQYSIAESIPEHNDPTLVLMNKKEYAYYREKRMSVFAFASQAKGFFQKLAAGGASSLSQKAEARYLSEENLRRFERIKRLSEKYAVSVGVIALSALLSNPDFQVIPIVGCKNISQLSESLSAADFHLSREDIEYIVEDKACLC